MSNVVAFAKRDEIASGRNRKAALAVIIPRIEQLHIKRLAIGVDELTIAPGLHFLSDASKWEPGAIYFRISGPARTPLMTGWLNPRAPGNCMDGKVHLMSWRQRGWERLLFARQESRREIA